MLWSGNVINLLGDVGEQIIGNSTQQLCYTRGDIAPHAPPPPEPVLVDPWAAPTPAGKGLQT